MLFRSLTHTHSPWTLTHTHTHTVDPHTHTTGPHTHARAHTHTHTHRGPSLKSMVTDSVSGVFVMPRVEGVESLELEA